MNRRKIISLFCLFSLIAAACSGTQIRLGTPAATETHGQPAATLPLTAPVATVTATAMPATLTPTITATPTGAWLSLSPAHGSPGQEVKVEGFSPTPPAGLQSGNNQAYTSLCWGGCQNGLQAQGVQAEWSQAEPGRFSLTFTVPAAAWLAADGPHNLAAGDYPISVLYLDMGFTACANPKGCMVEIQAGQPFHLDQGASGPACDKPDCGSLTDNPAQGAAGATIEVTGWAPLLQLIGPDSAGYSGYSLALLAPGNQGVQQNLLASGAAVEQAPDGSLLASFQVPLSGPDGSLAAGTYTLGLNADSLSSAQADKSGGWQPVLVASIPFEILPAPAWPELAVAPPLWIQPSASLLSTTAGVDPANPDRVAECTPGEIRASQDGGATWSKVPTGPAVALADSLGYTINPPPACSSVVLDPGHPDSYFAVFEGANKQYGAPPTYFLGFYTIDGGKTWQAAPTPPEGQSPPMVERFGGFWNAGQAVQALYSGDPNGQASQSTPQNQAAPTLVMQTTDGGLNWQPGALTCPPSGPCLRWGAAPGSISGMGAGLPQFVITSLDNGQIWTSTGQSVELHMSGPNDLAALSATDAVLISGGAAYPLMVTHDRGQSWLSYALPLLPGSGPTTGFQFNGLQILPSGSLVAMIPDTGAWYALPPGAKDWCKLKISIPGNYPVLLQPAGEQAWWLSPVDQSLHSTPLSEFQCGR